MYDSIYTCGASPKSQNFPYPLCFLLLALLLVSLPSAAQNAEVVEKMRLGTLAMQAGKPAEAERYFRQVIGISPQFPEGHLDLGLALLRQGQLEESKTSLQTAIQMNPQLPGAHMFLGITEYQMNRLDQASTDLQKEIDLNPKNTQALMWLGVVELAAGNPEKAVSPLDRAAELAPQDLNILDYRGRAHSLVARNSYAEMYKLDSDSWHVHRALGQIYAEQGQPKQAIAEFLAAIRLQPGDSDLYESLGNEYRKVSQFDLAAEAFQNELKLSPNNPIAMFDLASIRIDRDDPRDGVPMLEQVAKVYANSAPVYFYLGYGLAQMGKNDQAIEYLEKSVQAKGSNALMMRAYYEMSQVYRRLQKPADAQRVLAQFLKLKAQENSQRAREEELQTINGHGAAMQASQSGTSR